MNLEQVPPLTHETFVPRGMTALLDAIGRTINTTGERLAAMAEEQRPGKVIFVILTDGQENTSREMTLEQINQMITRQTEVYNWDFVFIGANQDAIQTGSQLGIGAGNSLSYNATGEETREVFHMLCDSIISFRGGDHDRKKQFFTDKERARQKNRKA